MKARFVEATEQDIDEAGRVEIVVHGVFHCARDPRSWKRRSSRARRRE